MIRRLELHDTSLNFPEELGFTRRRLEQDERARVSPLTKTLVTQLREYENKSVGTPADIVDAINQLRAQIAGELSRIACEEQLDLGWVKSFFKPTPAVQPPPEGPIRPRRGPNSCEQWLDVASDRATDARALASHCPSRGTAAVYMAGYAIECSLKALLHRLQRRFPTSGAGGHDLRSLWQAAGLPLSDLGDSSGAKTFFIECWSTDLRYERVIEDTTITAADLLVGAAQIVSYLQNLVKRYKRRLR